MQMPHVNIQTSYNTLLDVPLPYTYHATSYDAFVITISYSNSPGGGSGRRSGWVEIFALQPNP